MTTSYQFRQCVFAPVQRVLLLAALVAAVWSADTPPTVVRVASADENPVTTTSTRGQQA